jgi:hypothetical protein
MNATPGEKLEREERLAGAVRTILECLGEDPDREGLRKTPERYAKALIWMTRGYEERLKGDSLITSHFARTRAFTLPRENRQTEAQLRFPLFFVFLRLVRRYQRCHLLRRS